MSVKGWAEAHRHEGGIIKYLYDKVKALDTASGGDESDIASIKEAIGKASGQGAGGILKDVKDIQDAIGDEDSAASILGRIKALEDAIEQS
ncbi:MAG: hypothetical protein J6W71_03545 [Methanobrevibacter sp.]|nr:hypothetical protein [Methanobrevibacter sp.]